MPGNSPPEPDDPVKVAWPSGIEPRTWTYITRRTVHEFIDDGAIDAAGTLTFFAVLSVFPAALAIVSLIGVIGDGERIVNRLLSLLDQIAPTAVVDVLRQPLNDLAGTSAASFTLVAGVVAALWSASTYVSAFSRALNRIYEVDEGRPYWKRKPLQLVVTVLIVALVLVIAGIVALSGPVARAIGDALSIGDTALTVWDIGKWPLLAAAVLVIIGVLYAMTPNVRQPRFRWLSLGALVAIVLLGAASGGFAFYVSNFASYNQTFGTLAGVVIFLIWVFLINLALLLGAEFNTELERGRQLQAGIHSERQLQLPPRDTTASTIAQHTADVDEQHGALLRRGRQLPPRTDTVIPRIRRALANVWQKVTGRLR